jgi:hypothetical protein
MAQSGPADHRRPPGAAPLRPGVGPALIADLRGHLALCAEILALVERENQALRGPAGYAAFEFHRARQDLLPRLTRSLQQLREHRLTWQRLSPAERRQYPECEPLLRQGQDLIMKIVLLDRENEQALLRHGLVPPTQLPSVNRQRGHYVAELYRRGQPPV